MFDDMVEAEYVSSADSPVVFDTTSELAKAVPIPAWRTHVEGSEDADTVHFTLMDGRNKDRGSPTFLVEINLLTGQVIGVELEVRGKDSVHTHSIYGPEVDALYNGIKDAVAAYRSARTTKQDGGDVSGWLREYAKKLEKPDGS